MQGTLSPEHLSDTFRELQSRAASGILYVSDGALTKRIYFKEGRIVAAESGDVPDSSREAQNAVLTSVFLLKEGQFRFEERMAFELEPGTLDLSPEEVSVAAVRRARGAHEQVLRWPENAELGFKTPLPYAESTLSTTHTTLLDVLKQRFQPGVTMSDVLEMSPLSREETLEGLKALVASGIVDIETRTDEGLSPLRPDTEPAPARAAFARLFPSGSPPTKLGRFEVQRVLGRGSMGAVLLAQDPAIDRIVAIKLIQTAVHLPPSKQEKYKERFYREASSAGQLIHPNIVTVFDVGHTEDDTPFIVMEYVDGRTLTDILETEALPPDRAFQIALDILDGLSYAHAQGIVHRDIKPGNIIVTPDFRGKIMDFGIAHVVGSELTTEDDVLGSPYYMAPEQLSKGTIDQRTDIFSFAVVLYRLLTGELPFTGDSFAAIARAILDEDPVPPDARNPAVSIPLRNVVLRCLEKNSADRYDTAEEVSAALKSARGVRETGVTRRMRRSVAAHRDRWLPISLALILGAFLVFGLATPNDPEPNDTDISDTVPQPSIPDLPSETDPNAVEPLEPGDPPEPPIAEPPPNVAEPPQPKPRPKPPVASTPTNKPPPIEPAGEQPPDDPEWTVADLFYEARMALERGDLPESQAWLEELLLKDPTFAGAGELLIEVTDRIWEEKLPLTFEARHKHRLGSCEGELSLTTLGVRFTSDAHDWAWSHEDIRVLERPGTQTLFVETYETDVLSLGKNKRYRIELDKAFVESDWERYERITR